MDNWYLIVALLSVVVVCVATVINWLKLPNDEKIEDCKKWLRYAVTEAEKHLKSGTGQLKLVTVYDMFISKYPGFQKFISFSRFSDWVDEALEWMDNQLKTNPKFKAYVYGEDEKCSEDTSTY